MHKTLTAERLLTELDFTRLNNLRGGKMPPELAETETMECTEQPICAGSSCVIGRSLRGGFVQSAMWLDLQDDQHERGGERRD